MNSVDTVKTLITALQSGDMELAANCMSDDCLVSGLTPRVLARDEFLVMQSELLTAMPDFSYHLDDAHKEDNEVKGLIQITGTHTNSFSLSMFGLQPVQATGLAITLPQIWSIYQVEQGKVIGIRVEDVPGGGLSGLLQQVGVELPVLPREREVREDRL